MRRRASWAGLLGFLLSASAGAEDARDACLDASEAGQRSRGEHHLLEAKAAFSVCNQSSCPPVVQRYCGQWLSEVEQLVPTVVLSVRDAEGRDMERVDVLLDGKLWVRKVDGLALEIDPGPHLLAFRSREDQVEERIVVREGEKHRAIQVKWPSRSRPLVPSPRESSESIPGEGRTRWPLYVLGAAGAAAFTSFAVFGLWGNGELSTLRDTCGVTATCSPSDVDAARSKHIVADVSLVAGTAILAVGAWLFLRNPRSL